MPPGSTGSVKLLATANSPPTTSRVSVAVPLSPDDEVSAPEVLT